MRKPPKANHDFMTPLASLQRAYNELMEGWRLRREKNIDGVYLPWTNGEIEIRRSLLAHWLNMARVYGTPVGKKMSRQYGVVSEEIQFLAKAYHFRNPAGTPYKKGDAFNPEILSRLRMALLQESMFWDIDKGIQSFCPSQPLPVPSNGSSPREHVLRAIETIRAGQGYLKETELNCMDRTAFDEICRCWHKGETEIAEALFGHMLELADLYRDNGLPSREFHALAKVVTYWKTDNGNGAIAGFKQRLANSLDKASEDPHCSECLFCGNGRRLIAKGAALR